MTAPEILPAFPIAALVAALLFLASGFARRLRWVALGWSMAALPALAFITYNLWDHYLGPGPFSFWRFGLSPGNMSLLLPLAVISPVLLLASEDKGLSKGRDAMTSALCCLAIAAAMTAILCDHFFLLAIGLAVTTLCMAGSACLHGRGSQLRPAAFIPPAVSDLCLVLGVLFLYLDNYGRGLFFPAAALNPTGKLAAACALFLAAALLRLGASPFHRWLSLASAAGKEVKLVHLIIDLVLGAYLLYMITQVFFVWRGAWIWVDLGVGALTLLVVLRGLPASRRSREVWGLLAAASGAHIIISGSPASQISGVAVRFGVLAAVSILALIGIGTDQGWAGTVGGTALRGLPPLAAFAWRWMEFQVLILAFASGSRVLFAAVLPLVLAGALIEGFMALTSPDGDKKRPLKFVPLASGILVAVFSLALGLYPGSFVDLVMREYGLAVNLPFPGWTALGWAVLICAVLGVFALSLLSRRQEAGSGIPAMPPLPLTAGAIHWPPPVNRIINRKAFAIITIAALFVSWVAVLAFLGSK